MQKESCYKVEIPNGKNQIVAQLDPQQQQFLMFTPFLGAKIIIIINTTYPTIKEVIKISINAAMNEFQPNRKYGVQGLTENVGLSRYFAQALLCG